MTSLVHREDVEVLRWIETIDLEHLRIIRGNMCACPDYVDEDTGEPKFYGGRSAVYRRVQRRISELEEERTWY